MKIELSKIEAEQLSNALLNQMTRLNSAYCLGFNLKKAIKKEVAALNKLHSKICQAIK